MPTHDKKRIKPVIEEIESVVEEPAEKTQEDTPAESVGQAETPPNASFEETKPKDVREKALEQSEETEASSVPPAENRRMNLKLIIIITLLSALVAAFVSGGVYVYLSGVQSMETPEEKTEISLTPETSPTPEASATPTPVAVDISKLSVQVLNGSGAIGVAGEAKDVLTKAGFTVAQTGNAGRYDYKNTTIQVKSSVNAETVEKLKKSLEDGDYTVEIGTALPASSQYDVSVIVGAN